MLLFNESLEEYDYVVYNYVIRVHVALTDVCFVKMNTVPRVLFDSWSVEDFTALFSSEHEQDVCSQILVQFLQVCGSFCVASYCAVL